MRSPLAAAFLTCTLFFSTFAQAREASLGMVTGPRTGTYIAFGRDIAEAAKKENVNVEVKESDGSVDNIKRINSKENAALGIVQSDVLSFLGRSQNADTRKMAANLRMILPLYREEVHVLTRSDITDFSQLDGKRVVVGEDGSGHMLTAVNLMAMMNVAPQTTIRKSPPEGVFALLDGEADAVFLVGGKPVKIFQNLDSLKSPEHARYEKLLRDLHFLPLKDPRMLEEYQPAELTHADYDFVTDPVPTISVTAVLVTYDFSAEGKRDASRCASIHKLTEAIRKHLPELQKNGHPKWREVTPDTALPIWKKDSCAWTKPEPKAEKKPETKPAKKSKSSRKPPVKKSSRPIPADMRKVMYQR